MWLPNSNENCGVQHCVKLKIRIISQMSFLTNRYMVLVQFEIVSNFFTKANVRSTFAPHDRKTLQGHLYSIRGDMGLVVTRVVSQ